MNVHSSGFKSDGLAFIDADEAKKLDHVIIQPSDVLLNITGASIGRVTTAPAALAGARVNHHVCIIRPNEELSSSFLSYFLASPREQSRVMNVQVGATRQALTKAMILDWDVPVPPFHEQQLIVSEIEKQFSRLDKAIANLKRVKANLKRYKAAVLKAAVEGKLTEDWRREHPDVEPASKLLERILTERRAKWKGRGEYKEPAEPGTANLPNLPKGWVWATIAQIADVASGNTPSGVLDTVRQAGEIPWFKVGDMNHDENQHLMRHADAWLSVAEVRGLGLRLFQPNTVLFPKRGGAIATNKKRLLELPGCADLNVMGITPNHNIASYFFTWFDGVDLGRLSDGSNVPQVNHKDIEPLVVPLPPLDEQQAIVPEVARCLSVIEELEAAAEANLTRADRLRQSVLQLAFSDRLKVRERAVNLNTLRIAAEPNAPYISTEEIVVSKRPITSSRDRRALLEALEGVDSPVAPEELFSLCGFDSGSIEEVERFYAELNELISANKVEELRPTQDRVTLKVIQ
jgi:type I restriction enzyme S subunit